MFSKNIFARDENIQQLRDHLRQKLQSLFQDELTSSHNSKLALPDYNIYYKNIIQKLVKEESTINFDYIAKTDFPYEALLQRTALIDAVATFSLDLAILQYNINGNASLKTKPLPFALIARGGYGRMEMFPGSDIDLLIVSNDEPDTEDRLKKIIRNFEYLFIHQDIFPTSSSFGFLMLDKIERPDSIENIIQFRSFQESRFLCGSKGIFNMYKNKIDMIMETNKQYFLDNNIVYGESYLVENTVFQQEPDVKYDIRRFYWALFLAKIKFGYKENSMADILKKLFSEKHISEQVYERDQKALTFLIRVRLLLHLAQPAGNKDILSFEHREKIAGAMGFEMNEFYKEYFYNAARPLKIDGRNIFWHSMSRDEVVVKKLNKDFGENRRHTIIFLAGRKDVFINSPEKIFDVIKFVSKEGYGLSYPVILSLEDNTENLLPVFMNKETRKEMLKTFQIILKGKYFAKAIRDMNEYGLISRFIIPEFSRLCGLPQDIYVHRFPVDIHIMAAMDALNMLDMDQGDPFLVQLYQNLKNNKLLKLATLLHDIGKGYKKEFEDEDEVGASMIPSILKELDITNPKSINMVQFLVGKHLAMKDLLDLDPNDDETYEMIWKLIDKDMEKLRMLILLTFADRYGTKMKMSSGQIASLKYIYQKALYYEKKERVDKSLKLEFMNLINLPPGLQVQLDTYNVYKQSKNNFAVQLYYIENEPTDLVLCLRDQPEILYRISSIIAFNKLNVSNAQINTANKTALDVFKLTDINDKPIEYSNYYFIQSCLKEDIERVFVKGQAIIELYKNRILIESNTQMKYKEIAPKIRIIGRAVKIVTPDILGIFMQTTKTFASMNISIDRAIFHCRNSYATNVFYLKHEDISKINSNMTGFVGRLKREFSKLLLPGAIF